METILADSDLLTKVDIVSTAEGQNFDQIAFDRISIGGIAFDFTTAEEVAAVIDRWRHSTTTNLVTLTNPHSVMLCGRDDEMNEATRSAGLTLPDGVGITLGAALLGYGKRQRMTGPALMLELCDIGREFGFRHFFYGGQEGVADRLAERLSQEFPGLDVAGTYCPPFRQLSEQEDDDIVEMINQSQPDVLWVGLGAPKQEKWMLAHRDRLSCAAVAGVGAAFDFHSGNVAWAPSFVRKFGLEWIHRLALNPRRMWRRNLDSPLFLGRVALDMPRCWAGRIFSRPRIEKRQFS